MVMARAVVNPPPVDCLIYHELAQLVQPEVPTSRIICNLFRCKLLRALDISFVVVFFLEWIARIYMDRRGLLGKQIRMVNHGQPSKRPYKSFLILFEFFILMASCL